MILQAKQTSIKINGAEPANLVEWGHSDRSGFYWICLYDMEKHDLQFDTPNVRIDFPNGNFIQADNRSYQANFIMPFGGAVKIKYEQTDWPR